MKKKLMMAVAIAVLLVFSAVTAQDASAQAKTKPAKEKKVKAPKGKTADSGASAAEPYVVDLSQVKSAKFIIPGDKLGEVTGTVRNRDPFAKNYDDLLILLPELPSDLPSKYTRMTIRAKYFNDKGEEINQGDGNAMVSVIEDVNDSANIRGGATEGVYKNIPIKEYNVGGFSGQLGKDKGAKVRLSRAPGGVLFQNSNNGVKFIEVTAIVFHNGDYKSE